MPANHHREGGQFRASGRLAAILASTLLLVGCGSSLPDGTAAEVFKYAPPTDCSAEVQRSHVIAVVGTHANMPSPILSQADGKVTSHQLDCAFAYLLEHGGQLTVIGVDGDPVVKGKQLKIDEGLNGPARQNAQKKLQPALSEAVQVEAVVEGADLHRALDLALRTAQAHPEDSVIIVLDNGLSDRGAVNMTREGWTQADPEEVVKSLERTGKRLQAAPGTTVILSGLGGTADPQPRLDMAQERNVTEIWRAVVEASGATVTVDSSPWASSSDNTVELETGIVDPVENKGCLARTDEPVQINLSAQSLGFEPDGATIRPTEELSSGFAPLVRAQVEQEDSTLHVVGRTDSNPTRTWESNEELSLARADAVRDYLVELGADANRIDTAGEGYQADPDDGGPDNYDPGLGAKNRQVIVRLVAPQNPTTASQTPVRTDDCD